MSHSLTAFHMRGIAPGGGFWLSGTCWLKGSFWYFVYRRRRGSQTVFRYRSFSRSFTCVTMYHLPDWR